ncbi:protein-disulfide reductase DsbD [Thiorhodococcus mannitoliphagus]|uniref:Thiol:disulfide interchange protein DsbD n=1 Tax=Thiorhodococcus mannitoliphagus TaxID=329406 RepID=A0A6P1E197_9GAMM|nr:protein-disulfide reductase DsbD [Thiorhodococcus mannitoliphagus]NEX21754.1 protein-disulfide reductase DsbD [Thiorhodococcus mannitoliphagus]
MIEHISHIEPSSPHNGLRAGEKAGGLLRLARKLLLLTLLFAVGITAAQAEEDFLLPDQAFRISGKADGPDRVIVRWEIADGYYLYQSKLRFRSETLGVTPGAPDLPPAKIKNDEFFGEVSIYRDAVEVGVPLARDPGSERIVALEATSQGCADAGLCYPPHRQQLLLELPELAATTADPGLADIQASTSTPRLGQSLGLGDEEEILDVDEAFRFQAEVSAPDRLQLTWDIAPGTYLYSHLVSLSLEDAPSVSIGSFERPAGDIKEDSILPDGSIGDVEVYHDRIDLTLPLIRTAADPTKITLIAKYQGCAEIGICYPPQTQRVVLQLPEADSAKLAMPPAATSADAAAMGSNSMTSEQPPARAAPVSEQDRIAAVLADESLWVIVAVFFGLGLLLAFTPCVFPMIPILSGIIAGQGAGITTRKAFVLSLVYVLAMAVTYTVVGVLAGLFGANLQVVFQNPWILTTFALVFVLLALSMFGFYDLQLPSSLQSKLTEISNRQEGGTLIGVAIMGLLSALIVGPCVAPPLFGALIYISQTGDAVLGGVALFALSMGMGAPLIAIGTSAGKLLPRAGAWMDAVKAVFGVTLLGVAILLLERIIPPAVAMLLWGLLLICSAVYLGALSQLPADVSGWRKLWKGLGVFLLIYGALMLLGAAAGGRDTLQPLRGLGLGGGGAAAQHATFQRIKTVADLDAALARAQSAGKPVLLDFYADWCVSCKEMERYTFSDPDVIKEMSRFELLQADVTANDAADQALMQGRFGLPGPPAILFFDTSGSELKGYRVVGFKPAEVFANHLREVAP